MLSSLLAIPTGNDDDEYYDGDDDADGDNSNLQPKR